jgi:hypothetical protein
MNLQFAKLCKMQCSHETPSYEGQADRLHGGVAEANHYWASYRSSPDYA